MSYHEYMTTYGQDAYASSFLFSRPVYIAELSKTANVVVAMGLLSCRLTRVERTHVDHPDGRAENVAEHSLMLVKVAVYVARQQYPQLDAGKVAMFAACHDDVEAYVGDTPTDAIDAGGLAAKHSRETAGIRQLAWEFNDLIPNYVDDVTSYEDQTLPEARFVRLIDKILTLIIHIDDEDNAKRYFDKDTFVMMNIKKAERFTTEYPEFAELMRLHMEIAMYVYRQTYLCGDT